MYLLRLDDASEYMDLVKWSLMETLLDDQGIKPIVGVIPDNRDPDLVGKYERNPQFWSMVKAWQEKGWTIALHGHTHVYESQSRGINPVNSFSEFAGIPLSRQRAKVQEGVGVLKKHGINPEVFFAPGHTFDANTLRALKLESGIRVISDTVANDIYFRDGFHFIPQQSGRVRKLPFRVVTFCYHPNTMSDSDFELLEVFIRDNLDNFGSFDDISLRNRSFGLFDWQINRSYFAFRKARSLIG